MPPLQGGLRLRNVLSLAPHARFPLSAQSSIYPTCRSLTARTQSTQAATPPAAAAPHSTAPSRRGGHRRSRRSRRRGSDNWTGFGTLPASLNPAQLLSLSQDLKSEARRLGLGPTGVTTAAPPPHLPYYNAWLAKGYHGALAYMSRADRVARRADPQLVLPGARSIILTSLFYYPGRAGFPRAHAVPQSAHGTHLPNRGVLSSYAWGVDYHDALGTRLTALADWLHARAGGMGRYYVDTGAVLERALAGRAGLGFVGKNSMLIHPRAGSGFFIGALFTTLPLPPDEALPRREQRRERGQVRARVDMQGDGRVQDGEGAVTEDPGSAREKTKEGQDTGKGAESIASPKRGVPGCGKCVRCMLACPTGAIVADRVVDARKCISYLTIELKTEIPEELRTKVGNRIYGCDICQQVCPWNNFDWARTEGSAREGEVAPDAAWSPLFGSPSADVTTPELRHLLWATEDSFKKRFENTAILRIGRDRMARNAAVGLGNVGDASAIIPLGAAAIAHPSVLVREHAAWALQRIRQRLNA